MRTYLINLDRAPERLECMRMQLSAAGIDFVRIPAVDGRSLSEADLRQYQSDIGSWGWLTPGEVGCFLSHRLCWQAIADGSDDYGVILEDDVQLGADAGRILADSGWLPHDVDIVKVETAGSRVFLDRVTTANMCGRSIKRLRSAHYCTGGYAVSKAAAFRLLQQFEHFNDAVDDVLFSPQAVALNMYKIYQLEPALCIQQGRLGVSIKSSIEGREHKIKPKLGLGDRLKQILVKESQTAINKCLTFLGKRERIIVAFK